MQNLEIVCGKEIEIPPRKSFQENKTGHIAHVYSGTVVEILENLMNENENIYCRTDFRKVGMLVSNEKEPQTDFRVLSSDQRLPLNRSEGKGWSEYHKGMVVFSTDGEVEKLNRRLQILEDDVEVIKRQFFRSVEERKHLIHEIHGLFQIIHNFLCLQSSRGRGEEEDAGALIINPHKDRRIGSGLSQVLIQDSNPTALVTRGLRVGADMLPMETAESQEAFISRHYFFS